MYSLPGTLFSEKLPLDCTDFRFIRSRFYRASGLKELFDTVEPVRIFSYLKEYG